MDNNSNKIFVFKRHEYAIAFNENLWGKSNLEIIQFLREKTYLFKELPESAIEQLRPNSKIEQFQSGQKILIENTLNDKIYFLMKGTIGVYKKGEFVLALRRKGDIFGEMSLISDKPCSACVAAETDVDVFSIKINDLGKDAQFEEKVIKDSLYSLYAVILADKLALTTEKAVGLEQKVQERTIELVQANKLLKDAKEKEEKANKAKSNFLGNMTHELRTPLHHIYSFSQLGRHYFDTKKGKSLDCFNTILDSCHTMMGLIDQLIDISKFETGTYECTFFKNDMYAIIDETIGRLSQIIKTKKVNIIINNSDTSTKIICDGNAIGQVIRNLLSNSIKFSEIGKTIDISINSTVLPALSEKAIQVAVKDEGPGIPEEELEHVFDKFTQSSRTETGAGGVGLGLAVCHEIIKCHKGKIWVKNNEGSSGCTFSFAIPYHQDSFMENVS